MLGSPATRWVIGFNEWPRVGCFFDGRGADTSMLLLMSICSTLDTFMGTSVGGRREEVVLGTSGKGGPWDQPSSPSIFRGLEKASIASRVMDLDSLQTQNQDKYDLISMLKHVHNLWLKAQINEINHSFLTKSQCINVYWLLVFIKSNPFLQMKIMINLKKIFTQPYKIIKLDITTLYTLQTVNLSGMRKTLPHWCPWASQKLARWTGFWLKSEFLVDVFEHRWSYVRKALRRDDIREEIKRRKKKSLARQIKGKKGKKK